MCGIVGVSNHSEAAQVVFLSLYALQHRGEESCGIVSFDGKGIHKEKSIGLVADFFSQKVVEDLKGNFAVGHTRYSTTGSSNLKNTQPFLATHKGRSIAIAHNGNLTNTEELHKRLEEEGSIFQTTMDSEIIVHLLAKTKNGDMKQWMASALKQLKGAFSVIFLIEDLLVGARDAYGFRPLCLGKKDGAYLLASETCAFDLAGAEFVREVEPGEIVFIKDGKVESFFFTDERRDKKSQCVFENIYFARPDSHIFEDNVYLTRKRLGKRLAKEHPAEADFVMAIPDSGNYAALGYAEASGIPLEIGMIRNHYVGRTFIQPSQFLRESRVRIKLNPIRDVLKGKKIIVVEDSIVRGTTSRSRVEELRKAGAKEIHFRVTCPPITFPCFYGIDFPSKKELIASNKSIEEIAKFIRVDSLKYLSLEGMLDVMKEPRHFCHACFDGKYPEEIPKNQSKFLLE
ncbi:MAG: amidophosphoribosyltransferase [Candidatus Aceula meridiana]|nr:amidophosphoribosyltransferase [Candidatus Aceula meridiana]